MTKKDYIILSNALKYKYPVNTDSTPQEYISRLKEWKAIVEGIADALQADNSLFNRQRFYTACHPE